LELLDCDPTNVDEGGDLDDDDEEEFDSIPSPAHHPRSG